MGKRQKIHNLAQMFWRNRTRREHPELFYPSGRRPPGRSAVTETVHATLWRGDVRATRADGAAAPHGGVAAFE